MTRCFGLDGLHHGVGVVHLHANDLDLRANGLDVVGHARDQATAANGHKYGVQPVGAVALQLAQHFHGHGALSGNHVRVVKRVHKGQALRACKLHRVGVGVGVALAKQHHLAAKATHRVDLDLRGGGRHHDHGACAHLLGAQRHALGVVAGGGANHAFAQLFGTQVRHLVVGAAQLEAAHRLLVFALEQHGVVQALA